MSDNENIYDISYTIPGYKDTFESMGITVKSVKMPTFEDISKIIEKVSNKKFDLSEYEDTGEYVIGSIKDLIPKKYSWIYSTTYWVSTIYDKYPQDNGDQSDVAFFIDTLGNVCNADECEIMVGAGIRPLVTIENKNIIYPFRIESKTDGNGSIEVIDMAYADDLITFKVSPKKGYKLYSLKLTDSTGKSVSYKEDEIINNSDGTVSVNSFTMPSNDVTIEATFKSTVKNPKTGVTTPIIGLIIVLFVSVIVLVILDKRRMRIN